MFVEPLSNDQKVNLANGLFAGQSRSYSRAGRGMNLAGLVKALAPASLIGFLAACGTASGTTSNQAADSAPVTTNGTAVAPATTTTTTGAKLGTNVATIQFWDGSRPFMNLLYGGPWQMQSATGTVDVPPEDLDSNGWVKSVPAGSTVIRAISMPAATGDYICRFQGNGQILVGGPAGNVSYGAGFTKFTVTSTYPQQQNLYLKYDVDPTNYIRNIDCREASASTTGDFAPEFTNTLQGFKTIRFMKWQTDAVEANAGITDAAFPTPTITWANRNKPGDGEFTRKDGVPVELEVELANQLGASPFFSMPWNADDNYITQFATYVRDHLGAGQQAYVETSNEVWNWGYWVSKQAVSEAKVEGLASDQAGEAQLGAERYGEKTAHIMQIWSNVFAGQMNRLVRVYSWQNVQPWVGEMGLKNALPYVDAYATAPYWSFTQSDYTGQSLDTIMNTLLPAQITDTLNYAAQDKTLAQKYNLRYITYEGGQSVILPNNLTLLGQIEHDSRMYDLYKSYMTRWQSTIGDNLTLFTLSGSIGTTGAWGMVDYTGEPVSKAATPKMQAVRDFLGISTTTASAGSTSTTQVCPDGSVIPLTSTCPTTTTTSPGKSGASKGGTKNSVKTGIA
jgi:hypothetical protein